MRCLRDTVFPEIPGGLSFHIVHGIVDAVLLAFIIFCNSLIIFAILRQNIWRKSSGTQSSCHSSSVRLVLSLATSDILVGLSTIYFLSFEYSCSVSTTLGALKITCLARFVLFMASSATSCYSLIALAIDRYIAVVHALRYRDIMTNRVVNLLIAVAWILGVSTGLCLIFWNNWSPTTPCMEFLIIPTYFVTSLCGSVFLATVVVLGILHWRVHREAQESDHRNRSMSFDLDGELSTHTNKALTSKSAKVMYLVLGCIIILWSPVTVIVIARGQGLESPITDIFYAISFSFYNLSYIANTFIYSWKNTTIKTAIFKVFQDMQCWKASGTSVQSRFLNRTF